MARHDSAVGPPAFVANGRAVRSVSGSKEADMQNPWKAVTLGVLALGAIVGTSTLTTAYLLRPPTSAPETTPSAAAVAPESRVAVVRVAPPATSLVMTRHASPAPPPSGGLASDLAPAPLSAAVTTPAALPAPAP